MSDDPDAVDTSVADTPVAETTVDTTGDTTGDATEAGFDGDTDAVRTPNVVDERAGKPSRPKKKAKQIAAEALARNRRLRALLIATTAVAALLLAGCVGLAVWVVHDESTLSSRSHGAQSTESLRASAVAAAQQYVTDFSTFDYRSLDKTFAHTASELTGSFKTTYTQTSAALKATLTQYHETASTKVIAAAAQSLSASQAKVIVLFDQTVTSLNSKNPVVNRNRATVTLDRNGSGWLMSALDLN